MEKEMVARLEKLLDRELNAEEKERLQRIQDTLRIGPNDAFWAIIAAMEYQRVYYEELPEKICRAAADIFAELSGAADKEAALAQSRLAEKAKKPAPETHPQTRLMWGTLALILLLFYGSAAMWAGFCAGSEKAQPALCLLRMPVGIVLGAMGMSAGLFCGALAAGDYAEGAKQWRRRLLTAAAILSASGMVFRLAL